MKKITMTILLALMLLTNTISHADVEQAIHIYVKDERLVFPTGMGNPFISDEGRTMIPLRAVSEVLGYEVAWDQENYSAQVFGNDKTIVLPINRNYGFVNDKKEFFDTYTITKNGRSYVPLRFVSETLGYEVKWKYGRDQRAYDELAHIIDLNEKTINQSMKILEPEFSLNNDEFKSIMSKFGVEQTKSGTGGNYKLGSAGFRYDAKNIDNACNDFSLMIPSERNSLDNQVEMLFLDYTDKIESIEKDTLEHLFGQSSEIDDIVKKIGSDLSTTKISDLNGIKYTIGNFKIEYVEESTISIYVYISY